MPAEVRVVNGRKRDCHGNSSRKYLAQKTPKLRIVTGYCLDVDGLWRQHTWMSGVGGRITETTMRRGAYFGIELFALANA